MTPLSTLDDFRARLLALPGPDAAAADAVAARERTLTKPAGALGRLEELVAWLAAWQGRAAPQLKTVRVVVFAGNHGVARQDVSAYPPEVTAQMVRNFAAGGAAINQLCRSIGADLLVVPLRLARPSEDFTQAPALSEADCVAALNAGQAAVHPQPDLLVLGEMGIGNTTAAAALALALCGGSAEDWVGPGTGVAGERLRRKQALVAAAVARHTPAEPLALLARLGGFELAALAGAIAAARRLRVPVVLDGYAVAAAAAVLATLVPASLAHCLAGHVSAEPGHRRLLERLGLAPLLDLGLRLGEASGAALAVPLLRAALACHAGMASFETAKVSGQRE